MAVAGDASTFKETWQVLLDVFLEKNLLILFSNEVYKFESEIATQSLILGPPDAQHTFTLWLNHLAEFNFQNFDVSNRYKEEGNSKFRENKRENCYAAANCYTKALFAAPKVGTQAAICHSNRAAALLAFGFYEEAYDDCNCAIALGYPFDVLGKVFCRQATCALGMKDIEKLKLCINKLEKYKEKKLYEDDLKKFKEELKKLQELQKRQKSAHSISEQGKIQPKEIIIQKVMNSPNKGNYIIAGEAIPTNEPIMTEKAFAFVPALCGYEQIIDCNCQNCGQENIIPFPCYDCSQISYCSSKCRNEHSTIHTIECKAITKTIFTEIGIGHLTFRTFLVGFPTLLEYLNNNCCKTLNIDEIWEKILEFGKKSDTEYAGVMRLITNFNKMPIKDYLRYALTGSMLTTYLINHTSFFDKYIDSKSQMITDLKNWQIVVAALLTRHMGQMISNAHTINGLKLSVDKRINIWQGKNRLMAGKLNYFRQIQPLYAAIFPRISLYNHSCEPSFRNRFNKSSLTVISAKNLKPGDEILNSYGISCRKTDRITRLDTLKRQYHFDCKCMHCNNTNDDFYKRFRKVKCQRLSCKVEFYPDNIPKGVEIWDALLGDEHKLTFFCSKCNQSWNSEWYKEFELKIEKSLFQPIHKREVLKRICELYASGKKFLCKENVLRMYMSKKIVRNALLILMEVNGQKIDKKLHGHFLQIGIDLLNDAENYYGLYDLEYITCAIYILDILALLRVKNVSMRFEYEIQKIKKSFQILPDDTKLTFENYFKEFIEEKDVERF